MNPNAFLLICIRPLTVRARILGKRFAQALIITSGDQTSAYIDVPEWGKFYKLLYNRRTGTYQVFDIDHDDLEFRLPIFKSIPESASDAKGIATGAALTQEEEFIPAVSNADASDGRTVIDVMVVYTSAARQWAATRGGIQNIVAAAMANSQLVADNSDVGVVFRLALPKSIIAKAAAATPTCSG